MRFKPFIQTAVAVHVTARQQQHFLIQLLEADLTVFIYVIIRFLNFLGRLLTKPLHKSGVDGCTLISLGAVHELIEALL